MDEPRQLTLYCANGCGRKAATHSAVKIGSDGAGGHFVTSRLVCSECKAEESVGNETHGDNMSGRSKREHPFAPFPGTDAEVFIQWKGTEVCMDLHCPCGKHSHFDTDFAYYIRCPDCGAVYELGTQVKLAKVAEGEEGDDYNARDPQGDELKWMNPAR